MKAKLYVAAISLVALWNKTNAQANQSLSNLNSPTKVNVSLLPDLNNKHALGSAANSWSSLYLDGSLFLANKRFLAYKTGAGTGNTAVGFQVLFSNTSGYWNTGTGDSVLFSNTEGYENTASGYRALYANIGGHANSAFGTLALQNNNGHYNTAVGSNAMSANTSGSANVAIGTASLSANTIGAYNTSGGVASMGLNSTGNSNTAYGFQALNTNIRGNANVAIGVWALNKNENGSNLVAVGDSALLNLNSYWCTAVGSKAGMNNTTGSKNTYLGYHAGITITTGASNTIIGAGADVSSGTLTNATAIGSAATVNASNKVRIGNSSVTSIGGEVGWTNFSDERIKTDVKQNVPGLKFINLLNPVTYHFDVNKEEKILSNALSENWTGKYDIQKMQFTGFLAQEVEAAAKKIGYNFSGIDAPANQKDLYGLRYAEFVVPLVKAVQELSKANDEKDARIESAETKLNDLQKQVDELKAMIIAGNQTQAGMSNESLSTRTDASISQNIPNPFNHTTTINYTLPQKYSSAKIIVVDNVGKVIKEVNVSGNGKGNITVDATTLASGAYNYSLYVDGRLIDTKQMVFAK